MECGCVLLSRIATFKNVNYYTTENVFNLSKYNMILNHNIYYSQTI